MILRYPGGKSRGSLHRKILSHIELDFSGGVFAEPFFGGGGITIGLLKKNLVHDIVIGEKDISLLDLWSKVINDHKSLIRFVKSFEPSVAQFLRRKSRILNGTGNGFDCLVVNRLSHGGRGVKAGPQGGMDQSGQYKIGCRWNAEKLCKDISTLNDLFSFVGVRLEDDYKVDADYYYVDPPYWKVGEQMYKHGFTLEDHVDLKRWLDSKENWLLSYDNHPEVRRLYSDYEQEVNTTSGNGGVKKESELLIWT